MTDEKLKRANEIKVEIGLCKDLLHDLMQASYLLSISMVDDEGNDRIEDPNLAILLRPQLIELLRSKISVLKFEFKNL